MAGLEELPVLAPSAISSDRAADAALMVGRRNRGEGGGGDRSEECGSDERGKNWVWLRMMGEREGWKLRQGSEACTSGSDISSNDWRASLRVSFLSLSESLGRPGRVGPGRVGSGDGVGRKRVLGSVRRVVDSKWVGLKSGLEHTFIGILRVLPGVRWISCDVRLIL